jgi:hypothetical protein
VAESTTWRSCSACKKPIAFGANYWRCNVSTCNRKRTGMVFCSVECWEVHLPLAHHREAWAIEERAPREADAAAPARKTRSSSRAEAGPTAAIPEAGGLSSAPREVLIVASRLKSYVKARSGYNTSDQVLEPLSEIVRHACDKAIRKAAQDGRKTVLGRDVPGILED